MHLRGARTIEALDGVPELRAPHDGILAEQQALPLHELLKRDQLPAPDIGFALLPSFWSRGYAFESASRVLAHARDSLALNQVLAIVSPTNTASIGLLEKLGLTYDRTEAVFEGAPEVLVYRTVGEFLATGRTE